MNTHLRAVPAVAPRAVLYLRQSVARDDSISIELQEIAGRDYCAAHGYEVVAIEVDEGISGRTWVKRPAVQRVMEMIEQRAADVIVLWKWSRLSRNRRDWAVAADRVDVAGGRIESATEPIDTGTASGRFARGVMTEYAAFQSEQIGEQWAEVRARRFSLGLPPTGSVPWGWVSKKTHIEPHPDRAPHVVQMYRMYLDEGRGFTYISAHLNRVGANTINGRDWIPATVRKLLDSPIHAGYVEYHGEVKSGAHDGIISEGDWARYQRMRRDRHVPMKPRVSKHLLSSMVVCHCGRKRYGNTAVSRHDPETFYSSYVCPSTVPHPPQAKTIATWRVDDAVVRAAKSKNVRADLTASETPRTDLEAIAREIVAAERRLVTLTGHLVSGLVPEAAYRATRDKLEAELTRLQADLGLAERDHAIDPSHYLTGLERIAEEWDTLQVEEKQALLRTVIDSVTIYPERRGVIQWAWGRRVDIDL
ncbi:recombinase family protein [Leucobacter sp. GX24907]